jgi:hypothetical protein
MPDHEPRWQVLQKRGITIDHLRLLVEELHGAFSPVDGGFISLGRIPNELQRAVVSDQICQSAYAIAENLLEAHLHQEQLANIVGAEGVAMPTKETAEATVLRGAEMDMAITGCVRAMGSALDCLAATAIGVLRIPLSITRASFGGLANFPKSKAGQSPNHHQKRAWGRWAQLVETHEQKLPEGWFDWEQAMRNLNIHRGRQVHTLVQKRREPDEPQILVFDRDPEGLTRSAARFDLHLRNRPELPDMQDFVTSPKKADLWIAEPAQVTLSGVLAAINALTEEASHFLLSGWNYANKWGAAFLPPIEKWELEEEPTPFKGIIGVDTPYPVAYGVVNPHLGKRLELAEKLRP